MKKIFSIFAAMVVALGAFMFTGCDEIADALGGSDKWWTYEHQQEVGSGSVTLYFYFYYNTSDSYSHKKIKALSSSDFVKGLNVVIAADPEAEGELLETIATDFSKGNFILKTFPESEAIGGGVSIKDAWSSFYTINALKGDAKLTDDDDYPPILAYSSNKNLAEDGNIDLKSILVNILISGLTS